MTTNATSAIRDAVQSVVSDPSVHGISQAAAVPVTRAVAAEVQPIIDHLTNQEPWYASRVMLGSIATIVTSAFGLYALATAGVTDGELYAAPIAAIIGASFAIYGRFIARKPLGA